MMTPEQFLFFADPLPEPTLLLADDGLIVASNRAVEERLGISRSWLHGKRLAQVVMESGDEVAHYLQLCCRSRSLVLGAMRLHMEGKEEIACRLEGCLLCPKEERSAAVLMLRLMPKESAAEQFVFLNQRIEELGKEVLWRKRAEAETRLREEWLRVTLYSIGDGVICTDALGRVTVMNSVAEILTGWTAEAAHGQPLEDVFSIINEQTRMPVTNPVEMVLREGVIVGLANHTLLVASDGIERPIDDSAAPIRDATGNLLGVVLVFRDVTEQRRSEHELRASEARKSAILETALDCIIAMDHQGRVVEFNPAAERTFGYRRAEIIGQELCEFIIPPALRQRHRQGLAYYLISGEGPVLGKRIELSAQRANGTEFPVEMAITRNSNGDPAVFTAYLRDISESKRTERHRNARVAVTRVLSEATTAEEGAVGVLAAICEGLDWELGFLWRVDISGSELTCEHAWYKPAFRATEFVQASLSRSFAKGEGLPGSTWSRAQPTWINDVLTHPNFPRAATAAEYGLHSAFGCPVIVGERTLGVIEFFTKHISEPDADLLEMMGTVAGSLGQFLERQEAVDELRRSEQELSDFFENATVGLHWVGPDGTILRANRSELELLGYNRENYIGRSITDFHADGEAISDILSRLKAGQDLHQHPARLKCHDGSIRDVLIDSSVLFRGEEFVHTRCFTWDVTERKRAEAALRESEEKLRYRNELMRTITDTATTAIFMMDEQSRCTFMNPAAEQMTGYSFQEADGQILHNLIHHTRPDGSPFPVAECPIDRALPEGFVVHNHEDLFVRKDGSFFPVLCNARPVVREGNLAGTVIEVQDVTLQKEAEAALRESEERLRLALDAGRMGVWDWNIRSGELKWSDSLEPLHGLPLGTFGGTFDHFQQLIHSEDREAVNVAIGQALETAGEFYVEFRNVWQNGGIHWIAGSGKVFPGDDDRPLRMIGIGLDVTQRKRAEQTARFLADASAALAVLVDFDSTLQKVSSLAVPSFADWATVDLAEANGSLRRVSVSHVDSAKVQLAHDAHRRFPPDPAALQGVWNILRTGRSEIIPEITDELLVQSVKDAELLGIMRELGLKSYIGVPLTVRGKTLGVITFINAESGHRYDHTDLAVAEDLASRAAIAIENAQLYRELRDADQRKDEFLATLAHELRNPLAPLRNGLEILRLSGDGGEMAEQIRLMMERQLSQMVRLVDDLLDVSRITRNKLELRKERALLATILHSAIETSRPLMEQAGHKFSMPIPSEPIYLDADPVRLAQVFSNLLNNAAKYTEPGGRISITEKVVDGAVEVQVRDNGLGIPEDALPKIFDMFSQVDCNMERAQGGLGIGLTLVRRLVELHGGKVQAYSEGPGRGSTFTVRMPVAGSVQQQPNSKCDDRQSVRERRRILVVDDNKDSALSLRMMLDLMGHETLMAHDGLAAIESAEKFRPEIILLDIGLPKLNGYDVCRRIREKRWSEGIKIVAVTGWGQEEDRRRSNEAGFDDHLVKPIELVSIEQLLKDGSNPPSL